MPRQTPKKGAIIQGESPQTWPPAPQIIVPGPGGTISGHSGKNQENPQKSQPNPTQIPKYFGPVLTSWLDLVAARRSGWKKAARGCPRIQIWSHEGPNQSQNHVFQRSRCQPVSHGFAHPASRKARVASGLEPRHVLRKHAIFFFSQQKHAPWKNGMPN